MRSSRTRNTRRTSNSQAGRTAQAAGDQAEALVAYSLDRYQAQDRLTWLKTYPEIKVIQDRGEKLVIPTGGGPPDYCVSLAPGGRLMWLEAKTWEAMDRHTERKRIHQYRQMAWFGRYGALGAYLVCWRWKGAEEWRLYPVAGLRERDGGLLFIRAEGMEVDGSGGWPAWLETLERVQ